MKKIFLLMMSVLMLAGCEIPDDGPGTEQVLAEVIDADLPESFEYGKIYEIDITFLLPDACHVASGLQAVRGGIEPEKRRNIYVAGIAARPAGLTTCDKQSDDLEQENSFLLRIDENQPFTFYLWTGLDEDDKSIYTEIVVPVVEATPSTTTE